MSGAPGLSALHEKAMRLASDFRRLESCLAQCLGEVEETRLYFELGYPSLFQYATHALGLTESIAYALITVARTMKQVPELRVEIESGRLSVFKCKKICSVLKKDESSQEVRALNQEWIEKAKSMSSQKLEQEVKHATLLPDQKQERRIVVELRLTPEQNVRWERCKALASASLGRTASGDEAMDLLASFYLRHRDPVEKAKRAGARKAKRESAAQTQVPDPEESETLNDSIKPDDTTSIHLQVIRTASSEVDAKSVKRRAPIPAALLHKVHLRDQKKCQYSDSEGRLCGESRFTEIHHVRPLHMGGVDELRNLMTICKLCRMRHNRHYAESRIMPSGFAPSLVMPIFLPSTQEAQGLDSA